MKCLLFILIIFPWSLKASDCTTLCPQGRKEINLCIIPNYIMVGEDAGEGLDQGYLGDLMGLQICSTLGFHYRYSISKERSFSDILEQLDKHCIQVKNLKYQDHGYEGGMLSIGFPPDNLSRYSCVFSQNAHVDLQGCEAGKGCAGQLFLKMFAYQFLGKGGSVSAATDYVLTNPFFPGAHSENATWTTLSVSGESEIATYETLGFPYSVDDKICAEEMTEMNDFVSENKHLSNDENCSQLLIRLEKSSKQYSSYISRGLSQIKTFQDAEQTNQMIVYLSAMKNEYLACRSEVIEHNIPTPTEIQAYPYEIQLRTLNL